MMAVRVCSNSGGYREILTVRVCFNAAGHVEILPVRDCSNAVVIMALLGNLSLF